MSEQEQRTLPRPTSYDELFPGRFVKAGAFKGKDVTLTIDHVEVEIMPKDKGGEEVRGVVYFKEHDKVGRQIQLCLNKTNGESLKAMFGKVVTDWMGKRVTLFPGQDKFGRDTVDCIRVRGSPDLSAPVEFELKLPKKSAKRIHLAVTGKKSDPAPSTPPQP